MRVRIITDISLVDGRKRAGDIVDLEDGERLVGLGLAEEVVDPAPPILEAAEAAALADPPERAVLPRAKKRSG